MMHFLMLIILFQLVGVKTVELNLEPSLGENLFQTKIYGPASQVVPEYIKQFIQ